MYMPLEGFLEEKLMTQKFYKVQEEKGKERVRYVRFHLTHTEQSFLCNVHM